MVQGTIAYRYEVNGLFKKDSVLILEDQIGAGHRYTAALSSQDGVMYCWGSLGLHASEACEGHSPVQEGEAPVDTGVGIGIDFLQAGAVRLEAQPRATHTSASGKRLTKSERQTIETLRSSDKVAIQGFASGPWHLVIHGTASAGGGQTT